MSRLIKIAQILSAANRSKPTLYFLIGYPASGKSRWIRDNGLSSAIVINRDEIVEDKAEKLQIGKGTYDDMFPSWLEKSMVPSGMPTKEEWINWENSKVINDYMAVLQKVADDYNSNTENSERVDRYGKVIPYDAERIKKIIIDYGVPPDNLIPFTHEKIFSANEQADDKVKSNIEEAIKSNKDIIIDMMSLTKGSRDGQRRKIVSIIEGGDEDLADPTSVSKYYNQKAIVFTGEDGYSPELIDKIKEVNRIREEEMKIIGKSKTIPARVFNNPFEKPTESEGFDSIEYIGTPSLAKLNEPRMAKLRFLFFKISNPSKTGSSR